MFAKLLKYEWKSNAGLLGILSLAAMGVAVAAGFVLRSLIDVSERSWSDYGDSAVAAALTAPLTILLVFLVLALVAYVVGTEIIPLYRFYKSRFTDEGYLTFTLPVSGKEVFFSSYLSILLWFFISTLVVILGAVVILSIGFWGEPGVDMHFPDAGELLALEGYASYLLLTVLKGFVSCLTGPVLIMTCITLGAVLAKKHKILAALGLYYAMSMGINLLESFSEMAVLLDGAASDIIYGTGSLAVLWLQIFIQIGLGIGGCILSVRLMNKKLNLP